MKTTTATSSRLNTNTYRQENKTEPKPRVTPREPQWGSTGVSSFTPHARAPVSLSPPEPRPAIMSQDLDDLMDEGGGYTLRGPQHVPSFDMRGEPMPADRYEVEIRGHRIPVVVGQGDVEPGMQMAKVEEVAQALARLPDEALREVRRVNVSPHRNPDDPHWAKEYENPDFRSGMTTGAEGITTIYPHPYALDDAETAATLLHETTHAWTNREWGNAGNSREWRAWAEAAAADGHAVSDYATESVKEDVSETAALYLATRGTREFDRARAEYPNRFAILDAQYASQQ